MPTFLKKWGIAKVSKKTYIGVGVTAGIPVIGAAKQLIDAGRAIGKSKHKEDYLNSGFGAFSAGMGAVSALGGNILASSVSLNYNKSQNSYHREERMSVGSRLHVKGGVEYNGKNLHTVNLNMLNEGDTVYNITGNIIKEAGKSTVKENSDGKSFGLSISHDTFDSAGKIQNVLKPSDRTMTAGIGRGKSESQGEYYSHNQDITKGTTYYNNSPDVKIRGVDVQTGGIAGKVASLTVESVQDRTDGKSSGYNISYGIGIGEHAVMRNGRKEMADGLHTTNIGVGYSRGKHTERTTNAIGGFTAEHGVLDVIGKTVQTGSVIGGGFTLNTGTYEKNDLEDVNKRKNVGINLTFTPGVTDIYRNGRLTPDSVGGVLVGTRIDYSKDDYVAKVKATIGNNVNMTVAGKKADLSGVNRDTSNMVDVLKDRKINPVSIDLGTEYWATNYGREKTKGDFAKAGNKIERVVEIIKAVSENEGKDIGLYYRDRLDFEAERDRKERSGELETILIDRDKALEIAERAAGRKIDDLQIISTKDPNIKEIVGADAIAGRAYHVGNGKIVIVADNIGDYAKAMGTIAEEGRHIYHRNNNGLEDSEDYASFYGRQFERYYDRNFGNNDVAFITERLKYTKEQLGNDWENEAYRISGRFNVTTWGTKVGIEGAFIIVRNPYDKTVRIYFQGKAGADITTKFAGSELKLAVEYFPGVIWAKDVEFANNQTPLSKSLDKALSKGLNTYGIQKGSVYIKYYNRGLVRNPLLSNHHFSAIGIEAGYEFEMGNLKNLLDKVVPDSAKKGMLVSLKPFEEAVNRELRKFIGGNTGVSSYYLIYEREDPAYNATPTKIWRKIWERPKETLR